MERIGPNEVRGGPNRVSAQRRRRLCRALRDALCGVLREGTRGCAGVCRGMQRRRVRWNRAGCGTTAGGVLRREGYRDGGRTGRSGGRGGGTKGCGGGGCGGCGELRMASCGVAAGGWPVVVAVGCRPRRRLRRLLREWLLWGRNAPGEGMRGDCRFCRGMGRRMDVEELTGRRGFCPRGGLSGWKADGAQRRKVRS